MLSFFVEWYGGSVRISDTEASGMFLEQRQRIALGYD